MNQVPTREQLDLIAEFGPLYNESQAWAPRQKRLEAIKETMRSWYPDLAADQTAVATGTDYEIQIGEQPIEKTWISMHSVYKAAGGLKPFLTLCEVTFKALAARLGQQAAAGLQLEARTGKRKIKAVARVAELPKVA